MNKEMITINKIDTNLVKRIYQSLNYSTQDIKIISSLNDVILYKNNNHDYICINSNIVFNNFYIYDLTHDRVILVKINNLELELVILANNNIQLIMYTDMYYKFLDNTNYENSLVFIKILKESINDLLENSFDKNKFSLINQIFIILTLELSIRK